MRRVRTYTSTGTSTPEDIAGKVRRDFMLGLCDPVRQEITDLHPINTRWKYEVPNSGL